MKFAHQFNFLGLALINAGSQIKQTRNRVHMKKSLNTIGANIKIQNTKYYNVNVKLNIIFFVIIIIWGCLFLTNACSTICTLHAIVFSF